MLKYQTVTVQVLSLLLASAMPAAFTAQPARAQAQTAAIAFDIPAGPLSTALATLGRQARLQIAYDPAILGSRQSAGLRGSFTPEQALQRLLDGSGLMHRFVDAGTVTLIEAPRSSGATTLPSITVAGERTSTDIAATEGSRSYTSEISTVGGKGPVSIREVPQSISVVTRQRMDDQNITTLDQAMKRTTGMSVTKFDGAGNFNTIQARGFDIDNVMLDGVNMSTHGNLATGLDASMYDRIEVLRGPAGLFQGSGEPGGVINMVRKHARPDLGLSGGVTIGSWETYRAEADVTSKLIESGKVRARMVAVNDERDSFVDILTAKKKFFYGTVEFDLTPDTTLSVGGSNQEVESVLDQGLPVTTTGQLLKLKRSTFIGARWNQLDTDSQDWFTDLEHKFSNGGSAKFSLHRYDRSMFYYGYRANSTVTASTGALNMQPTAFDLSRRDLSLDGYYTTPVELWGLTHTLTAGVDYRTMSTRNLSGTGTNIATNIYNPVHDVAKPSISYTSQTLTEQDQYSAYGQARIKPVDWVTLIGGARVMSFDIRNDNLLTGRQTSSYSEQAEVVPYAGVVVDVNNQLSVYASYAEIFAPQTNLTVTNEILAPRTGEQYEVGLKSSLFDGKGNAHAAVYQVKDENRAVPHPTVTTASLPGGLAKTHGFETEISGTPMEGLDLMAGYSFVITEYLNRATEAASALHTPKHTLDLSAKYSFLEPELKGWYVTGNMRAVSPYKSNGSGLTIQQDGYAVFSTGVGYEITPNVTAALLVNNLFDREYYEKISLGSRQNFYGEPRSAMLVLKAKW